MKILRSNLITKVIHVQIQPLKRFSFLDVLSDMKRTLWPYFVISNV